MSRHITEDLGIYSDEPMEDKPKWDQFIRAQKKLSYLSLRQEKIAVLYFWKWSFQHQLKSKKLILTKLQTTELQKVIQKYKITN